MEPENYYFILTKKSELIPSLSAGQICYMSRYRYRNETSGSSPPVKRRVIPLSRTSSLDYQIEAEVLTELPETEAGLLQALGDHAEQLRWFEQREVLQVAVALQKGSEVCVEQGDVTLMGVICYIGPLKEPFYSQPLPGTYFGIELQPEHRGQGNTDGTHDYRALFHCEKNCGVFAPFTRVRPRCSSSSSPPPPERSPPVSAATETEQLGIGDRVTFFIGDSCRHGMVLDLQQRNGEHFVRISTDTDESGKTGGEVEVPLNLVAKGEVPTEPESMELDPPAAEAEEDLYTELCVNSLVEVSLGKGNSYGIIRWIGRLPGRQEMMAGLELDDYCGVSDGTFKNERFFQCPPLRALFVKLSSCRPDGRFQTPTNSNSEVTATDKNAETDRQLSGGKLDPVPPVSADQVAEVLIGRMKGIQGHCNSCYMDATLFSLFSCSSALDAMLFKHTDPEDARIQETLLYDIVDPLRRKGFVKAQHVMDLRQQLQKHGYSCSFTTDEKDPEEFLTVIMHHILALDPLLKLSAGDKVQESYCYQIFLDQNHSLVLPTVQQLLEHSFHSAALKLAEVPSCFILQMPRFGKQFKMFDKIIPSLELDVTDLLCDGPQQCIMCGQRAAEECAECFTDPVFSKTGFKLFCEKCSSQVHTHPQRRSHHRSPVRIPSSYGEHGALSRDKLELFAVLCIETSHYVAFIKYGPDSHHWIFFDSMADRQGEIDGYNIPEVRACPEVGHYLDMPPAELANQAPRDMKGVAKRLFCDAYMYLYQSPSMCLYR